MRAPSSSTTGAPASPRGRISARATSRVAHQRWRFTFHALLRFQPPDP
jgi:hypothetical protein